MKVKEENEKAGLKLNIQKTKIMASGPITSQEIDGETWETVADFIFLGFLYYILLYIQNFPVQDRKSESASCSVMSDCFQCHAL